MNAVTHTVSHFERLGLPEAFAVDPADLETRYLALSAELHPDGADHDDPGDDADPAARVRLLEASAAVNEAYRTLKDPYLRAEYLLSRLGGPGPEQDKRTPAGFLEEMLDLRERIDDALTGGDPAAAEAIVPALTARRDALLAEVAGLFAAPAPRLGDIRVALNAVNYFRRMLQQIRDAKIGRREP